MKHEKKVVEGRIGSENWQVEDKEGTNDVRLSRVATNF
jgi:hypothetical protein